jgi:hypothetical protein
MTYVVFVLAVAASSLTALSFALSRLIPDDYDLNNPRIRVAVRTIDRHGR